MPGGNKRSVPEKYYLPTRHKRIDSSLSLFINSPLARSTIQFTGGCNDPFFLLQAIFRRKIKAKGTPYNKLFNNQCAWTDNYGSKEWVCKGGIARRTGFKQWLLRCDRVRRIIRMGSHTGLVSIRSRLSHNFDMTEEPGKRTSAPFFLTFAVSSLYLIYVAEEAAAHRDTTFKTSLTVRCFGDLDFRKLTYCLFVVGCL